MKISSNKSSSIKKKVKSNKDTSSPTPSNNESFSVETIKNGFIISKSWTDKEGRYKNERTYSEKNPLATED